MAMLAAMPAFAQYSDETVLMTVGDKDVTCGEFSRIYTKNNPDAKFDSVSIADYMPLFIDYKLKVVEAETKCLDTTLAFKSELEGYRVQLEKPYFTDKKVDEALFQEAYDHMQYDLKASHILIRCADDAQPADTLKAYKKIQAIYKRALKEDFNKLARETSEDPSVQHNNGYLGYFTAFTMIYDFEKVAYSTPVGQVSKPFRSRFGYHILKVENKRPARGYVKVSHILVRSNSRSTEAEAEAAEKKIRMVYDSIAKGADWNTMVARYSEDRSASQNGGELQWFGTAFMVTEFEDAAFALKEIGDISQPVRTPYAWHIIKLIGKRAIPSYDEAKTEIKRRMSGDARSNQAAKAVCERLKKEYNFKEDKLAFDEIANLVDSTILFGKWKASKANGYDKVLFSFADSVKYTQHDFALVLSHAPRSRAKVSVGGAVKNEYAKMVQAAIFKYERTQLQRKYPDFRYLLQEYHDGILLFNLTDREVWTKAVTDSLGLTNYYNDNKQKYMWGDRAEVVSCSYNSNAFASEADNKKAETKLVAALKAGVKKADYAERARAAMLKSGVNPDSIGMTVAVKKYNILEGKDTDSAGNAVDVKYCDLDGIKVNENAWGKSKSKTANVKGRSYVYYLVKTLPPMPKTLNECRGNAAADYQVVLEKQWIQNLRDKYQVKINDDVLKTMIK